MSGNVIVSVTGLLDFLRCPIIGRPILGAPSILDTDEEEVTRIGVSPRPLDLIIGVIFYPTHRILTKIYGGSIFHSSRYIFMTNRVPGERVHSYYNRNDSFKVDHLDHRERTIVKNLCFM